MDRYINAYFRFCLYFGACWLFIIVGLGIALGLVYIGVLNCFEIPKYFDFAPSLGILLGGQIAGLSVFLNINHSKEQKLLDIEKEKEVNKKLLNAYYIHMKGLTLTYQNDLKNLKEEILTNDNYNFQRLEEFYYDDETNTAIYIKPLDTMLDLKLHKYTDDIEVITILNIKEKVLDMMKTTKVARNLYSEKKEKVNFIKAIDTLSSESTVILEKVEERITYLS